MTSYTSDYFIQKLAPIPENKWIVGNLETDKGKCTAGWLGGYISDDTMALGRMFIKHLDKKIEEPEILEDLAKDPSVIVFNANDCNEFYGLKISGSNPKERILTLLYQIRKKELQDANVALAKSIISNRNPRRNEEKVSRGKRSARIPVDA